MFHDEHAHFEEISAAAEDQAETFDKNSMTFTPLHVDYTFEQMADLPLQGITRKYRHFHLADFVAGSCMRWYPVHMQQTPNTDVLDRAIDRLLRCSDRGGVGINVVAPREMA